MDKQWNSVTLSQKNEEKVGPPGDSCLKCKMKLIYKICFSYFNVKEAEMVLAYIKALVKNLNQPVSQEDIGVVTPYIRQVIFLL